MAHLLDPFRVRRHPRTDNLACFNPSMILDHGSSVAGGGGWFRVFGSGGAPARAEADASM